LRKLLFLSRERILYKELSKHYLGIVAALLIALLIGIFFKEIRLHAFKIIIGVTSYFVLLGISLWLHALSKNKEE
jgi:high-affinity Fe2+/Pb2+ permease